MVTEERLIRILFSRWIHDMRKKQLPDLEAREETVRDVMTMISINMDGFEEKIENDGIIKQR